MTVRELIARLSELPPDAVVVVIDGHGEHEVTDADVLPTYGANERVYITGD